jgi:hypothetical protein
MPAPDTITDQQPVGKDGRDRTLRADPKREYVAAGGGAIWHRQGIRTLSWDIDDLTHELGDDIYVPMMFDAQITACVNIIKTAILADGLQLVNALKNTEDDGYDQSKEYIDFCGRVLDDMEIPLDEVLWNLMDALCLGNKVAEQVYELDTTYTGRQQLVLRALKVKPRTSTAFVVDDKLNVLGLTARRSDQPAIVTLDADERREILPRQKFLIMTNRPKDSDPRGTSILRAAYSPWWLKMQLWAEYLKYLTQFASPSIVGETAENAMNVEDPTDPNKEISPEQAMLNHLLTFRNGTAIAIPYSAKVSLIFSQGDGQAFLSAFALFDQQIGKAIVHQSLATEEGEHQARAAAQVHQDVLGDIIRQMKVAKAWRFRRDVLAPLVRYNYGDKAVALTPKVNLGDVEKQDFSAAANAIAQLTTAGFLQPSQFPEIDRMLGMPERGAIEIQPAAQPAGSESGVQVAPPTGQPAAPTNAPPPPQQDAG